MNKGKRSKNKKSNQSEEDFVPKAFQKNEKDVEPKDKTKSKKKNKKNAKDEKEEKKIDRRKKIKRIILICILIILLILGIWIGITTHQWKSIAREMMANENSSVVDINGKVIAKLGSERKSEEIALSDMPDNIKNAYVAIEDERFYTHGGIDIKRTGAAIMSYVFHFGSSSYGGSTITQQLVKNLTGDNSDSIIRKVNEWWKACQLETCMSKEEILEEYLNILYVGPNMYGVETGSKYYFSKSSKNLTLEECAFLAGINNSPNSYNPFGEKDTTEKIETRTKTVLNKMKELNYISEEEYSKAVTNLEKGLKFKKGSIDSEDGVHSYHTDALITETVKDISKKYNISQTFGANYINLAGLTIKSTQNPDIQKQIETEFEKKKYSLASKNGGDPSEAAMVIIDQKTGYVTGCVGGLGKKTTPRSLNRATQSIRQTGSSIKPLSVLAPAIDKKIITAASIYDDTPRDFEGGYHPTDYNAPLGNITIRRAVESSQNVPFVEVMNKLKPNNAIKYLEKMGITTLTKEDETLVLSLGGLQKGISPLEMAGAYATIANDGEYIEPTFYSSIVNRAGSTVTTPNQTKKRVISKEVAYILKELLIQPVVGKNGTATYCNIKGVDVAAKTGTTDENYDRWLCGFTPYYTAVAWFGYDKNESIEFNNRNPAGLLWANVMSRIHGGLKSARFERPTAISSTVICSKTGLKANTECPNTYLEYFLWFTLPGRCNEHGGSELNDNNINNNAANTVTDIIQGITTDIDVEEPPITRNTNTQTTNTNVNTNTTKNNTANSSNTNTNKTNTNTNININTNTNTNINTNINTNTNTNLSNNTNTSSNKTNTFVNE